jgi:16S rRNA (uracil1498-N3)-methyltransferase
VCGVGRDGVRVRVTAAEPDGAGESPLDLTLAVALLKSDKLDWVIEKATELGVSRLQPFASAHSLAHPSTNRTARWQQIAHAAAKQCGRSLVPPVAPPCAFADLFALPAAARLLLAEHGETTPLVALALDRPASVLLIIGPEGGFDAGEVAGAQAAACTLVGLGPRIMRAETAAITAAALCQSRWGDLGGGA